MKICSITCFIDPCYPFNQQLLQLAGNFLHVAVPAFTGAGYEVQSARLATVPFPALLPNQHTGELARLAQDLERAASSLGFAYVSLGPALPGKPESYNAIPQALAATQTAFFSGMMTTPARQVSLPAVRQCARVIEQASTIDPDGFANLRFTALANTPPGSPFFPTAYHRGGAPCFALATEAADLAVNAFSQASSLEAARQDLTSAMERHARALAKVALEVEKITEFEFGGIDFSLAPYPNEAISLGAALEQLGVPALGGQGSLAAAAILADSMDQAKFKRAGFSGLMLPVLEDSTLARRAAQGRLGLKDLLLFSAVCGTGLDTVPLPGATNAQQLAAVLLDLASLSLRLDKPLTTRLMPIPGKVAGELTEFDFPFFANSRVLPIDAEPLVNFLAGDENYSLRRRPAR